MSSKKLEHLVPLLRSGFDILTTKIPFHPDEAKILSLVNGIRSMGEIAFQLGLSADHVARMVGSLVTKGAIVLRRPKGATASLRRAVTSTASVDANVTVPSIQKIPSNIHIMEHSTDEISVEELQRLEKLAEEGEILFEGDLPSSEVFTIKLDQEREGAQERVLLVNDVLNREDMGFFTQEDLPSMLPSKDQKEEDVGEVTEFEIKNIDEDTKKENKASFFSDQDLGTQDVDDGEQTVERLVTPKKLSQIIQMLARLMQALYLYEPKDSAIQTILSGFCVDFLGYLAHAGDLTLHIKPWEISRGGEVVYHEAERENSLSNKLYQDGVRILTFREELTLKELSSFLEILSRCFLQKSMDENFLTRFWECEFSSILAEFEAQSFREVASIERIHLDFLGEKLEEKWEEEESNPSEKHPISFQRSEALPLRQSLYEVSEHWFRLAEKEIETLPTNSFLDLLDELRRTLLFAQEWKDLLSLYQRVKGWQAKKLGGKKWSVIWNSFFRRSKNKSQICILLEGAVGAQNDLSMLLSLLEQMGGIESSLLFELLENESVTLRKTVCHLLVSLAKNNIEPFVKRMANASTLVRKELLYCLYLIRDEKAINAIASNISHPDMEVQRTVTALLEDIIQKEKEGDLLQSAISKLVVTDRPTIRRRVYTLMFNLRNPVWAVVLLQELRANTGWAIGEQKLVARLSAILDPEAVRETFVGWARPVSASESLGFLDNLRHAALVGLAVINEEEIRSMLEGWEQEAEQDAAIYLEAMQEFDRYKAEQSVEGVLKQDLVSTSEIPAEIASHFNEHRALPSEHTAQNIGSQEDILTIQTDMQQVQMHLQSVFGDATRGRTLWARQLRNWGGSWIRKLHALASENQPQYELWKKTVSYLNRQIEENSSFLLLHEKEQWYLNDVKVRVSRTEKGAAEALSKVFKSMDISGVWFFSPMTLEQLKSFVLLLSSKDKEQFISLQKQAQLGHTVRFLSESSSREVGMDTWMDSSQKASFSKAFLQIREELLFLFDDLREERSPAFWRLRRACQVFVDVGVEEQQDKRVLLTLWDKSHRLLHHSLYVAWCSFCIAKSLQWSKVDMVELMMAALLHDLGHLIPRKQLNHYQSGLLFLLQYRGSLTPSLRRLLAVGTHADGTIGDLCTDIIQVADRYALLTLSLNGASAYSPADAVQMAGGRAELWAALCNGVGKYPMGTILHLEDGSLAVSLGNIGAEKEFASPAIFGINGDFSQLEEGAKLSVYKERLSHEDNEQLASNWSSWAKLALF